MPLSVCKKEGLLYGGVAGSLVGGLAAYLIWNDKYMWATAKKVAVAVGAGTAVATLAYFTAKNSCDTRIYQGAFDTVAKRYGGLGRVPRGIRCPKVKGISAATWKRAVRVEREHTKDAETARCIAAAHLEESPRYYAELAKMERRLSRHGR